MTADLPVRPGRVLVVIPTYNERENLPRVLAGIRAHVPTADVLVVDDGSPDGTGTLAEELAAAEAAQIGRTATQVLHRTSKDGIGPAYVAGFSWAMDRGYEAVVEMDADGSHRPADLPSLLVQLDRAELVIGSRWVPGGAVVNWPLGRQLLSRGANIYTQIAGLPVHDATAGFRAYRMDILKQLALGDVASHGYCFQIDMAWRVRRAGGRIVEVPITFVERELGQSKMSRAIVLEALANVTIWGVQERSRQVAGATRRVLRP